MRISSERIELIMATKGITPFQLAEKSGVSRQTFSTIKSRGTCTPATAAKIAFGLDSKVEDIIVKEDSNNE